MCLFCLLSLSFSFFFFCKTVNFDEWFESLESFISIVSTFLKLWFGMRRRMNQTHFEWYEFDINVVLIFIATFTYKTMLYWVRLNQSSWISMPLIYSYSELPWVLMGSEKAIHCWSRVGAIHRVYLGAIHRVYYYKQNEYIRLTIPREWISFVGKS